MLNYADAKLHFNAGFTDQTAHPHAWLKCNAGAGVLPECPPAWQIECDICFAPDGQIECKDQT